VRAVVFFNLAEFFFDDVERLVPCDLAEAIAVAQQRPGEAVVRVDVSPGKLALDAGGDAVCRTVGRLDLEDVAVARPDLEAAADGAVGADSLGALDAGVAHLGLDLGEGE